MLVDLTSIGLDKKNFFLEPFQLISITSESYASFDSSLLIDISKTVESSWLQHEWLFSKIKGIGVKGGLLTLIESSSFKRKPRVAVNEQEPEWLAIKAAVCQGSILGLLFFHVYINDLSDNLHSNIKPFEENTSAFSVVSNPINTS